MLCKTKWTQEKIVQLIELSKENCAQECARIMETTEGSVRTKAYELNIKFNNIRKRWSKEDIEKLRELVNQKLYFEEISKIIGRTVASIYTKCSKLDLQSLNNNNFTDEEKNKIKELFYRKYKFKDIANQLNRTYGSVAQVATSMGLQSDRGKLILQFKELKIKGERRCIYCKQILPIEKFHKGRRGECKECTSKNRKERYNFEKTQLTIVDILRERLNQARYRAIRKNQKFELVLNDILDLYNKQSGKCHYSGIEMNLSPERYNSNALSIDKIIPTLGYIKENVVLCCDSINTMKNNLTLEDFFDKITKIYQTSIKNEKNI